MLSDGLATYLPSGLLLDGHQLATGNLVRQKPSGVCHGELSEEQHIVQNKDKCRGTVAVLCPKENEKD